MSITQVPFSGEVSCDEQQNIYFLVDVTSSNEFNRFCQILITIDLLVAAFNPMASNTRVSAYYFLDGSLWTSSTTCFDIVNHRIPSLFQEFGRRRPPCSRSTVFPGICGDQSRALPGLRAIVNEAVAEGTDVERAAVILTDGNLEELPGDDIPPVLQDLINAQFSTCIVAGLESRTTRINMKRLERYTIGGNDYAIVKGNPRDLGITLVNRLNAAGVLCDEHGKVI